MLSPRPLLLMALLLAGPVAGCGAQPAGLPDDEPLGTRSTVGLREGDLGRPDQGAIDALMAMERAQRSFQSAAWTAEVYEQGAFGSGAAGRTTWQVAWAHPDALTMKGVASTVAGREGLEIKFAAGAATVRKPGLRGLFPAKRELTHADVADLRGTGFAALQPAATAARLAGAATARLVGELRVGDATCDLVEVPRGPSFDPAVTREVLGVDRATGALRLHRMYAERALVYEQRLTAFRAVTGAPARS